MAKKVKNQKTSMYDFTEKIDIESWLKNKAHSNNH